MPVAFGMFCSVRYLGGSESVLKRFADTVDAFGFCCLEKLFFHFICVMLSM